MELKKLNEDYLVEMASIGLAKLSIGSVYLIVRPNERGLIPHFHVHLKSDGSKFGDDICVRLDEPEYFLHGSHAGTLNSGDCRKLNSFLHDNYARGMTNWEYLAATWDHDHPEAQIGDVNCPDYKELIDNS